MRALMIIVLILVLAACGGVRQVATQFHVPRLESFPAIDSYYKEGWKNLELGKPELALKMFQQSMVDEERLFVGYAYSFLGLKKTSLARKNFQKALDLNPDNWLAELGMASIYEAGRDNDQAFAIYARLLARLPGNDWIKSRYREIKATQTAYYLDKARQYREENKTQKQIDALMMAARYSPDLTEVKRRIADFYYEKGDHERAVRYYEQLRERLPQDDDLLYKLADLYERQKKIDAALVTYEALLGLHPGDPALIARISELTAKFKEVKLPEKFKNIFFKESVNREDTAALLEYYFKDFLTAKPPVIIRDISGSYAKEAIIKICSLHIMEPRPDHSFDRFSALTRADFAAILDALIKYLRQQGRQIIIAPREQGIEPSDISSLHKHYQVIKFLVNAQILKLDEENRFDTTRTLSPAEVMAAIKQILHNLD